MTESTTTVVYVGPSADGVEIFDIGQWADRDVPVSVPASLAGRPPSGEPDDEDHDPGEGLLAQPDNWAPASQAIKVATVAAVLDSVGDDPERAAAALEAERARGDKARPTLISQLETISNKESSNG